MDINGLYISMDGTVKIKSIGDEYKVFHNKTKSTGIINDDGKKLLEYCNGKNKIEDIINKIANLYVGEKEEIEKMVVWGLKHFKWISLVKTKKSEIQDLYNYHVFDRENSIELDHAVFYVSEIKESISKFINKIIHLENKGMFQYSLICSDQNDKDALFDILERLSDENLIVNLMLKENMFYEEDIKKLKNLVSGKIIMELNENIINEIKKDIKSNKFIKTARKIIDLDLSLEIQLEINNSKIFEDMLDICSMLGVEKVYYNYLNYQFKDEIKVKLDDIENKLFSEYRMIPESIEGCWFNSTEMENIEFLKINNMED